MIREMPGLIMCVVVSSNWGPLTVSLKQYPWNPLYVFTLRCIYRESVILPVHAAVVSTCQCKLSAFQPGHR